MSSSIKSNTQAPSARFGVFALAVMVLGAINFIWFATAIPELQEDQSGGGLRAVAIALALAAPASVVVTWLACAGRLTSRRRSVAAGQLVLLVTSVLIATAGLITQSVFPDHTILGATPPAAGILVQLSLLHLAFCMAMPITVAEGMPPLVLALVWWTIGVFVVASDSNSLGFFTCIVMVILSPATSIPGSLVAFGRAFRGRERDERAALELAVEQSDSELTKARIIHDAMFPGTFSGHVAFDYEYAPLHEIGGDYVHTYECPRTGRITLTLLDVAGHGLAAALTVNRLFGELERIRAENCDADPAEVMRLLNRYIWLTMASHDMYATGACFQIDPAWGRVEFVNAGHPPAMIRRSGGGGVEDMPCTCVLLGVFGDRDFDPAPLTLDLNPGDVLIAYTDGAFEARNVKGEQFGLARVRETVAFDPPPRSWTRFIAGAVAQHHEGHADDDVLIATLTFRSRRIDTAPQARSAEASPADAREPSASSAS